MKQLRSIVATVAMLGAVCPALAHEHMYIASTAAHGGALALSYDFTRAFPVVPLPGSDQYLGTDPAFNALLTDDPAHGLHALPKGTVVKWEITAMDPEVSVVFNGKTMKVGSRAKIGKMPYLHQHPEWYLTLPPGVMADHQLSFRVLAKGYQPSPAYTGTLHPQLPDSSTTTTTTPGGGSTTTTIACVPPTCDDGDECTVDTCQADGCHHDDAVDVLAVTCRLDGFSAMLDGVPQTSLGVRHTLAKLYRMVGAAQRGIAKASAGGPAGARALKRAQAKLSHLVDVIDGAVKRNQISATTADALRTLASAAYDKAVLLGSG